MKKTVIKFLGIIVFAGALIVLPEETNAAQCPSNVAPSIASTNPACWTQSGSAGGWSTETCYGEWKCGYPLYICADASGNAVFSKVDTGNKCGKYSSMCYDGCGQGGCANDGWSGKTVVKKDVWTPPTISHTCHYFTVDAWEDCGAGGVPGIQDADTISWHTKSGQTCENDELTRACCGTATTHLDINGSTGSTNVTQEESFTLNWSFANPGYEYMFTCTISAPTSGGLVNDIGASTVVKPASELLKLGGNIDNRITRLANYSTADTLYTYTLNCAPYSVTPACLASSKTVDTKVTAIDFSIDVRPKSGEVELGTTVNWEANVRGGYPPHTFVWSGDVVGNTENIAKRYGLEGIKNVTLNAHDSAGTNKTDTGMIEVVDSRRPQ